MANDRNEPPAKSRPPAASSARTEIDAFLRRVRDLAPPTGSSRRGRLIFALDSSAAGKFPPLAAKKVTKEPEEKNVSKKKDEK